MCWGSYICVSSHFVTVGSPVTSYNCVNCPASLIQHDSWKVLLYYFHPAESKLCNNTCLHQWSLFHIDMLHTISHLSSWQKQHSRTLFRQCPSCLARPQSILSVLEASCLCSWAIGTTPISHWHIHCHHTWSTRVDANVCECVCVSFLLLISLPLKNCQEGTSQPIVIVIVMEVHCVCQLSLQGCSVESKHSITVYRHQPRKPHKKLLHHLSWGEKMTLVCFLVFYWEDNFLGVLESSTAQSSTFLYPVMQRNVLQKKGYTLMITSVGTVQSLQKLQYEQKLPRKTMRNKSTHTSSTKGNLTGCWLISDSWHSLLGNSRFTCSSPLKQLQFWL